MSVLFDSFIPTCRTIFVNCFSFLFLIVTFFLTFFKSHKGEKNITALSTFSHLRCSPGPMNTNKLITPTCTSLCTIFIKKESMSGPLGYTHHLVNTYLHTAAVIINILELDLTLCQTKSSFVKKNVLHGYRNVWADFTQYKLQAAIGQFPSI